MSRDKINFRLIITTYLKRFLEESCNNEYIKLNFTSLASSPYAGNLCQVSPWYLKPRTLVGKIIDYFKLVQDNQV